MLKQNLVWSGVGLFGLLAVSLVLSLFLIKKILDFCLQARIAGSIKFAYPKRDISKQSSVFASLMKKEFLQIFRTPNYTFSYFSIMLVMPMMVYFCLSIGSSLIVKLIGVNCDFELAIFLTFLFGTLTNIFCSTNISRDGSMFYSLKAMPISHAQIFGSKIVLCMIVSAFSQAISAVLLCITGFLSVWATLFLFATGVICAFAQICFATRFDFDHAKFSTEDDGEVTESSGSASIMVVLGMLVSFSVGAILVFVKMLNTLKNAGAGTFTYVFVSVFVTLLAGLSYLYLARKLKTKYYEFSGGGLI